MKTILVKVAGIAMHMGTVPALTLSPVLLLQPAGSFLSSVEVPSSLPPQGRFNCVFASARDSSLLHLVHTMVYMPIREF